MLCCAKNRCCELACKQVFHLGESREVMQEKHTEGELSVRSAFSDSRFALRIRPWGGLHALITLTATLAGVLHYQ